MKKLLIFSLLIWVTGESVAQKRNKNSAEYQKIQMLENGIYTGVLDLNLATIANEQSETYELVFANLYRGMPRVVEKAYWEGAEPDFRLWVFVPRFNSKGEDFHSALRLKAETGQDNIIIFTPAVIIEESGSVWETIWGQVLDEDEKYLQRHNIEGSVEKGEVPLGPGGILFEGIYTIPIAMNWDIVSEPVAADFLSSSNVYKGDNNNGSTLMSYWEQKARQGGNRSVPQEEPSYWKNQATPVVSENYNQSQTRYEFEMVQEAPFRPYKQEFPLKDYRSPLQGEAIPDNRYENQPPASSKARSAKLSADLWRN